MIQTPSGGNLPQENLCSYMDQMIAALVRGSELGTLSQHNSQGASMQANETSALLEDDCALMSETLQTHLDRAVIKMVHGDEHPAAYVVINPPSDTDIQKDLTIDTGLKALGVTQDPSDLAERYGREVMTPIIPTAPISPILPAANAQDGNDGKNEDALQAALSADLRPLGKALAGALKEGDLPAMQAALKKISADLPEFLHSEELANLIGQEMAGAYLGNESEAENAKRYNPQVQGDFGKFIPWNRSIYARNPSNARSCVGAVRTKPIS